MIQVLNCNRDMMIKIKASCLHCFGQKNNGNRFAHPTMGDSDGRSCQNPFPTNGWTLPKRRLDDSFPFNMGKSMHDFKQNHPIESSNHGVETKSISIKTSISTVPQ